MTETLYDTNTCDRCPSYAPWSIADYDDTLTPVTTWYACGRHLALVLRTNDWNLDAVEVRYWPRDAAADPYAN
jgi:hypothetical protein